MRTTECLDSFNSLVFRVVRGPVVKRGSTIIAGILDNVPAIDLLASLGRPVHCYDTKARRITSKLSGTLSAFALPKKHDRTEYHIDDSTPIKDVAVAFLLSDVPMPCMTFMPGSILVGNEVTLREALKGLKFFPRAAWRDLLAVEITGK